MARKSLRCLHLHALLSLIMWSIDGSTFTFDLDTRQEDCYFEMMDARTTTNKMLFRFEILEPETYDAVDVRVKSPTGRITESFNQSQSGHVATTVRESGLYQFCFRKKSGTSNVVTVFYAFDFISAGSRTLTVYPSTVVSISRANPTESMYTGMELLYSKGAPTTMGIVEFDFRGVSTSVLHENTRVILSMSVDYTSKPTVELTFAKLPMEIKHPLNWNSMKSYAEDYQAHVLDNARSETGALLSFDITEVSTKAMQSGANSIAFSIQADEDASAKIFALSHVAADHWPIISFEDVGVHVMQEVAYFKEKVFSLKGEISYILQQERSSRNAAESTNTRVIWVCVFVNTALISIAVAQVLYVRQMLGSGY